MKSTRFEKSGVAILLPVFISFLLVVFFSCTKPEPVGPKDRQADFDLRTDPLFKDLFGKRTPADHNKIAIDEKKVAEIYTMPDITEKRLAFGLLSNQEKSFFWNNLVKTKIENSSFTEQQKELLTAFRTTVIHPNIFSDVSLQEILKATYLPRIDKQFRENGISSQEAETIFGTGSFQGIIVYGDDNSTASCTCNLTSIWRCSGCKGTDCTLQMGCGALFLFSCDALCPAFKPGLQS